MGGFRTSAVEKPRKEITTGESYRPEAGITRAEAPPHRLQAFQEAVTAVYNDLGRPVFIAEFGYPAEVLKVGPFSTWNHALEQYPLTPLNPPGRRKRILGKLLGRARARRYD
jgi:hypothetical protein